MGFILWVGISIITSATVTKILAIYYFEIVDGYVESVVNDAKKIMVENFSHQDRLLKHCDQNSCPVIRTEPEEGR